nr:hypothetical protein HmN_000614700 [Hymenolepis microstoma]
MEFAKAQLEDSEKVGRSDVPYPRRLLELEKFQESVLNPSEEFSKSSSELSNIAMKTLRKMPKSNLEQLGHLYPKVLQAKICLDEYRKMSSLQTNLLETVLDTKQCDQSFSKAVDDIKSAIESSVKPMYVDCCQQMKDVTYRESIQTFTPLLNYHFTPNTETQEIIANFIDQQLGESLRTMIMDLRIKVAEQMLTFMMESLKKEFTNCLKDFPSKVELEPLQPPYVDDTYVNCSSSIIASSLAPDLMQSSEDKPRSETLVDARLGRPVPPSQKRPQRNQTMEKETFNRSVYSSDLYDKPIASLRMVETTDETPKSSYTKPDDAPASKTRVQLMPDSITAEMLQTRELKRVHSSSTRRLSFCLNSMK